MYAGSAKRNLTTRLTRHLRQEKPLHWHIDSLRAVASVVEIWIWPWTEGAECRTNVLIQTLPGAGTPWTGFGSSDCRCRTHLTVFPEQPRSPRVGAPVVLVALRGRFPFRRGWHLTPEWNGRILTASVTTGATKEQP